MSEAGEAEAISVVGLVVRYGDKVAVNGLSFTVRRGTVYGLLGPNGAGKTSTIKALVGLVEGEGTIRILGRDAKKDPIWAKQQIGLVPESPTLFDALTPNEFFELLASIRRLRDTTRLRSLIRAFAFEEYLDTPIGALSMGNRQKCAVIAALMHEPPILILDEPFNGLDVRSVKIFKDLIAKHREAGGAVLFSTHIMEVAERICDRVCILNEGSKVAEGSVEGLKRMIHGSTLEEVFLRATHMEEEIQDVLKGLE